jgi:hypothetical protein
MDRLLLSPLIATIVSVAAMLTQSTAQAAEVTSESTGAHCPAVVLTGTTVSGGCPMRIVSEDHIEWRNFIGTESQCNNVFEARFDEDGNGYMYAQALTSGGEEDGCSRVPCDTGGAAIPWRVELTGSGPFAMELQVCVVSFGFLVVNCHMTGFSVVPSEHGSIELRLQNPDGSHKAYETGGNSMQGHWISVPDVAHPAIELGG